jgi:hypothetical protein
MIPQLAHSSIVVFDLGIEQRLLTYVSTAVFVSDLHVACHVHQGLGFHKRLEEIVGHVLVTGSNLVDFVQVTLFHLFFHTIIAPIICDLVVDEFFTK